MTAIGETTINGGSRSTLADARGKLTFAPIGSSVEGWNRFEGRVSSVVAVHLAPAMSDHDANDISKIPPALYFENNNLKATLQKLQSVLDGSGIDDHAYAETLGLLLLWELRHAADLKPSRLNSVRGGLTPGQLRRVKEFINAEISNDVTISDLAAVAGLSQFHFIRAFKDSIGLSPYQYVPVRTDPARKRTVVKPRSIDCRCGARSRVSRCIPTEPRVSEICWSYANGLSARDWLVPVPAGCYVDHKILGQVWLGNHRPSDCR
jgi:hypothetical protein